MKTDKPVSAVCPLCGKPYSGVPALSRTDNQTPVCPDCGIRQALESIGVSTEEREKILSDRKSTRLNSSHANESRMPSSA